MPNLTLNINNPKNFKLKTFSLKKSLLLELIKNNFLKNSELNIHFVSEKKIQALNKKYRNINKPTDVLSFGQISIPDEKTKQLGDIFICYNIAKKQALNKKSSTQKEIEFLSTHGLKHLLGIHHN